MSDEVQPDYGSVTVEALTISLLSPWLWVQLHHHPLFAYPLLYLHKHTCCYSVAYV